MDREKLMKELKMEPLLEGGYFSLTYRSSNNTIIHPESSNSHPLERPTMTSIYCMLTKDAPIHYFHKNCSDIMHYFHMGLPIKYSIITPEGRASNVILGPDILAGQKLQMLVPGGCWKAAELLYEESDSCPGYGLFSEAVTPGFDQSDMSIATRKDFEKCLSQEWKCYEHYIKK